MTSFGTPCGACKFLRRKCVKGCVFAPYFCHEQGATHFAAIHKVFGASNVAKHLGQLPVCDRNEAAVTISYEAQARVHDPVYGCVSHIFALQQQVVSLQAQLETLKNQATNNNNMINDNSTSSNPNEKYNGKPTSYSSNYPQNVQSWLQSEYPQMMPRFDSNPNYCSSESSTIYRENQNELYSMVQNNDQDVSLTSYEGSSSSNYHNSISSYEFETKSERSFYGTDDLHSMAFGYSQHFS